MIEDLTFIAQISIKSSVAVLLATVGGIINERSGVLNLGIEGMMLIGALAGFAAGHFTGSPLLAVAAGTMAGGLLSLVHAFFTIGLRANQVLSGLALTILGTGLANFLGRPLIGQTGVRIRQLPIPYLSDIPVIGDVFFNQSPFAYAAYLLVPLAWYIMFRTRTGLILRAVGEDARSADVAGVNVPLTRTLSVFVGGLFAGLAGTYLSLSYTPGWKETMTGGAGMDRHCHGHLLFLESAVGLFRGPAFWRIDRIAVLLPGHVDGSDSILCAEDAALPVDYRGVGAGFRHLETPKIGIAHGSWGTFFSGAVGVIRKQLRRVSCCCARSSMPVEFAEGMHIDPHLGDLLGAAQVG